MMVETVHERQTACLQFVAKVRENCYLLLGGHPAKSGLLAWPIYEYHYWDIHDGRYGGLELGEVLYGL